MNNVVSKLKSRKLWVTVGSFVAAHFFPELIPLIKFLAPAYVLGQGYVDGAAAAVPAAK
jgi:hypothetical protein